MNLKERKEYNQRLRQARVDRASEAQLQQIQLEEAVQAALPGGLLLEMRLNIPNKEAGAAWEASLRVLLLDRTHVMTGWGNTPNEALTDAVRNWQEENRLPF